MVVAWIGVLLSCRSAGQMGATTQRDAGAAHPSGSCGDVPQPQPAATVSLEGGGMTQLVSWLVLLKN